MLKDSGTVMVDEGIALRVSLYTLGSSEGFVLWRRVTPRSEEAQ
jgi:hypothetical protein